MLSLARGVAWLGAIIVWWSLNVVWRGDAEPGNGPPDQWQRHVVGAGLLALIGAISLSVSGRKGAPPSWIARGLALACAAGIGIIAMVLRNDALRDFPHLIAGPGWSWLIAGGGFLLSAATLSFGLKPAAAPPKSSAGRGRKNSSSGSPWTAGSSSSGASSAGRGAKRRKKRKR